jgi:DNA-directed RNA polymerase specialized sigma24 family protein
MGKQSNCRCGICEIEKSILAELVSADSLHRYGQLVSERPLLLAYPVPSALVAQLHACRTGGDNGYLSDRIIAELVNDRIPGQHGEILEKLLLLIFIPAVHAAVRQVSSRYAFLPREDIAQHALITLLQSLRSEAWRTRHSHFAFTMARRLKRSTFEWADHEFRSTSQFAAQQIGDGSPATQSAEEAFERNAALRHFLALCQKRAQLTSEDLNLLIDLKLEGTSGHGSNGSSGNGSNPFRQRLKRLLSKLRRLARTPRNNKHHARTPWQS